MNEEDTVLLPKAPKKRRGHIIQAIATFVVAAAAFAFALMAWLQTMRLDSSVGQGLQGISQNLDVQNGLLSSVQTHLTSLDIQVSSAVHLCNSSDTASVQSLRVISAFSSLSRSSTWTLLSSLPLQTDVYHPQGIVSITSGDGRVEYFLSTVDVIDRSAELGRGFVLKFDESGQLLDSVQIGEGAAYHPGGMDYDGQYLYVPVAEYHSGPGTSLVYRIDPYSLQAEELVRFTADHVGAIVHNRCQNVLQGVSWGSRMLYTWSMQGQLLASAKNPENYVDYQDCKYLPGTTLSLCSGLTAFHIPGTLFSQFQLGGLGLVDLTTGRHVYSVPVTMLSAAGNVMTLNPMQYIWMPETQSVEFLFAPDNVNGTVYRYSVQN